MTSSRIPTWDSVDRADPRMVLKPAFVGLPWAGTQKFTPPADLAEDWSEQLTKIGVCYVGDIVALADEDGVIRVDQLPVPELKLVPPHRGQQHPMNATMQWVGVDEPDPEPVVIPNVTAGVLTRHEQEVIAEQLRHDGVIQTPEPARDVAQVEPSFQPADHTPSVVRGYLLGVTEQERRRVIALEMTGKARQQILNQHKGV